MEKMRSGVLALFFRINMEKIGKLKNREMKKKSSAFPYSAFFILRNMEFTFQISAFQNTEKYGEIYHGKMRKYGICKN